MPRNTFSIFVYGIIGLAAIGLVSQLFTNTAQFLTQIFMTLVFGAAIFAVIYFLFFKKKAPSTDTQKYKKAVKQSKAKYETKPKSNSKQKSQSPRRKKKTSRSASHLRVIDGNKSNRKDRASF